jgi:nucleotide-binding universal stress UspA family protein
MSRVPDVETTSAIMLCIDDSTQAKTAFEACLKRRKPGTFLYLVTVIADEELATDAEWIRKHLQRPFEETLKKAEVVYKAVALVGDPAKEICKFAEQHKIDTIVIGNKKMGVVERALGSVSTYVVSHAPCNVFIVKEHSLREPLDRLAETMNK